MKLSFKKQPKLTGLAAVGHPNQSVEIKGDGKTIGVITAPSWQNKISRIMLVVENNDPNIPNYNPNCKWRWATLKNGFGDTTSAQEFVVKHFSVILQKFKITNND